MKNEYLNFVEERDRDTKKVVAARVSEDVLRALNMAEKDSERFGYSFSTTNIIDKALNNTLLAIKDHSGIDYYKLVKWQNKILGAYKSFLNCVDLRHATSEVLEAISFPESVTALLIFFIITLGESSNEIILLRFTSDFDIFLLTL